MKLRDYDVAERTRILVNGNDYISVGVLIDVLTQIKEHVNGAFNTTPNEDRDNVKYRYLAALQAIMDTEIDL